MKPLKVLCLLPYPLQKAPSQRFRIETFFPLLAANNIRFRTQVFFDEKAWAILYKNRSALQKTLAVLKGFAKRIWAVLFLVHKYDIVLVHREAAPLGPPVFEWMMAKLFRKKMIFDFDDAIWIPNTSAQNKIAALVKCFWKTKWICKWSWKIAAGNQYLAAYAMQFNSNVIIVPTTVDTESRYHKLIVQNVQRPSIGWTGSHSTLKYLEEIIPVLQQLEKEIDFDFYVICNKKPSFPLQSVKFLQWTEHTEMTDLQNLNIGVMPLTADLWSEGKCGFKIIQYLALGIPAVASPVGVNKEIVEPGINGFLCESPADWHNALKTLLTDSALRSSMGEEGRKKIMDKYSNQAIAARFLELFN